MDNQNLTPPPYREDVVSQAPEVIVETADVAKLFTKVFYWMAGALGLTALTAFLVYSSESMMMTILMNRWLMWGLFILELGLVMGLSAAIHKVSFSTAVLMMAVYSVLNGVTLSVIFLVYTYSSIAMAFVISAGMFAVMAIVGTVTKTRSFFVGEHTSHGTRWSHNCLGGQSVFAFIDNGVDYFSCGGCPLCYSYGVRYTEDPSITYRKEWSCFGRGNAQNSSLRFIRAIPRLYQYIPLCSSSVGRE